jgi:hypothetical protein
MKKNIILIFATLVAYISTAKSDEPCTETGKVGETTIVSQFKPAFILYSLPLDSNLNSYRFSAGKSKFNTLKQKQNVIADSSAVKKPYKSSTCKLNCPPPKKRINLY